MSALSHAVADGAVVAKRNIIKIKRVPEVLVWVLMSPIMFVLLFAYVFGGAIDPGGGVNYREFLIGGIFAQTVVFGATFTGAGIAEDMSKGIIDRFRSLPMARPAVLVGRTASDIFYNSATILVISQGIETIGNYVIGVLPQSLRTGVGNEEWRRVGGRVLRRGPRPPGGSCAPPSRRRGLATRADGSPRQRPLARRGSHPRDGTDPFPHRGVDRHVGDVALGPREAPGGRSGRHRRCRGARR
jgi:hypothetical protein